jgi:hypothetical protein
MYPYERINTYGLVGSRHLLALFPVIFVLGLAAGTLLPVRPGAQQSVAAPRDQSLPPAQVQAPAVRGGDTIWKRAGNPEVRHPVEVVRNIDGDTFETRVHLWPGLEMTTRVRLRGIDAPELKASCPQELQMAVVAKAGVKLASTKKPREPWRNDGPLVGVAICILCGKRKRPGCSSRALVQAMGRSIRT